MLSVQLLYIIQVMKIAVTGSSGLIGTALLPALDAAGHDVVRLVRNEPAGPGEARWDIAAGTIDEEALQEVEAIVHLAGENIGQRWSDAVRKRVLDSRVDGTRLIAETAARLPRRPDLLCASAVGFYGSRGDESRRRELAPRVGLPRRRRRGLGGSSGARPRRRPAHGSPAAGHRPREAGRCAATAAAAVQARRRTAGSGSGRQWWSWVSLDDVGGRLPVRARAAARGAGQRDGAGRVTNSEFVKALGRALHRPTIFPLPSFAVKAAFGQMGEEMLLGGQRVAPTRLEAAGFTFGEPDIDSALAHALAG